MIFFLTQPDASSSTFKILLIASEIIIPLIVFIGAYFIFKPLFAPKPEEGTNEVSVDDNSSNSNDSESPEKPE